MDNIRGLMNPQRGWFNGDILSASDDIAFTSALLSRSWLARAVTGLCTHWKACFAIDLGTCAWYNNLFAATRLIINYKIIFKR